MKESGNFKGQEGETAKDLLQAPNSLLAKIAFTAARVIPILSKLTESVGRKQYRLAVSSLATKAATLRKQGVSPEDIARLLHAERREIAERFRSGSPPDRLQKIYDRNKEKYGCHLGPSIEWLRARGKSWDEIVESAARSGGRDLDL